MRKLKMLKNVKYHGGLCTKRIVFSVTTGLPKPVGRVDKNTKNDNAYAGTYQEISNGDLLVKSIWENGKPIVTMEVIGGKGTILDDIDFTEFLLNLNPLWIKWLTTDDNNVFLPKGCGWDGVFSENDKLKFVALQQNLPSNLPQEIVDRITKACYFTALKEIDKQWFIQHAGLNPVVPVSSEYDLAIEEFTDGTSEVTVVNEEFAYQVTKETIRYILIKFIPLKVKGAEKLEWNIININH